MKTKMMNPQTFRERRGMAKVAKVLSLLFIAGIILFTACKKDKKLGAGGAPAKPGTPGIEVPPANSVMVSTLAGTGDPDAPFNDGPGTEATFKFPSGVAIDEQGNRPLA